MTTNTVSTEEVLATVGATSAGLVRLLLSAQDSCWQLQSAL